MGLLLLLLLRLRPVQVMLHAPLLRSFYLGEGHDPGSCRLTARDKPCLSCQLVSRDKGRQEPWGPGLQGVSTTASAVAQNAPCSVCCVMLHPVLLL